MNAQKINPKPLAIQMAAVYKGYQQGLFLPQNASPYVLENVSMNIHKGEFVYVIGDSGAGKTTLLKMLYGEEIPTRGNVNVLGVDLAKANESQLLALRRKIGVIFQDLRLIDDLSVYDNVALALETGVTSRPRGQFKELILDLLNMLGIKELSSKQTQKLSGGERQRVAAARALIRQPEIIIADEPTGALDREQTWILMDILHRLNLKGTTVILATHDREIVRKLRRRSCVLKTGKLVVEDGVCIY